MEYPLYKESLLDHYRNPRNRGELAEPDIATQILNPSCGDEVSLQLTLKDNYIQAIAFDGRGCVISIAAASMLTERVEGKSLEYIQKLTKDDMLALIDMELGPTRLRCALLALECLHKALTQYKEPHA